MVTPSGYTLSTPSLDDIPEVARFIMRWDKEMSGVNDFTEDDLRQLTSHPSFDPDRDWWVLRSHEGIAAHGAAFEDDPGSRYGTFGIVDTKLRGQGLGSCILDLIESRMAELAGSGRITADVYVDSQDPSGRTLVESRGYELVRKSYTMLMDLGGVTEPQELSGVKMGTASRDELPSIHALLQDGFSEHFGFAPTPLDIWMMGFPERADTSPQLWFKAEIDGELGGVSLCTINEEMGFVAYLAVLKRFRGRGIAKALLRTSFREFQARGCMKAGLGVDASNETGAVQLYESVGMSAVRVFENYRKDFGS